MASANTPSANEPTKDLILVSGRMLSSDVAFASVYSENPSEEVDDENDY